jgi:hypothetical protein
MITNGSSDLSLAHFSEMQHPPPLVRGSLACYETKGEDTFMAEKKSDKCAHPGCACVVAKGSKLLQPVLRERGQGIFHRLQLRAWGVCGQGDCRGSAVILNVQFFVTWIVTQLPLYGTE